MNAERVWFIVRGMTHFINRMYKCEKFGVNSPEITPEDLYLPRKLKAILYQSMNDFKNTKFVAAHNHCVAMLDREEHVKKSFRTGLLEIAREQPHLKFLHECVLYIMSATEMEQLCFPEAKYIVMDAIYQACMNTWQHEKLVLWDTQTVEAQNSTTVNLSNKAYQERRNELPSSTTDQDGGSRQNDDEQCAAEIDIVGM